MSFRHEIKSEFDKTIRILRKWHCQRIFSLCSSLL